MKARWFSRASLVSVALVASVGVAACSQGQTTGDEVTQKPAAAVDDARATAQHGPGHRLFRQIDTLDLGDDQRDDLRDIEDTLAEDLSSYRQTLRDVAETLAQGVERGKLDPEEAARTENALAAAAIDARTSITRAVNEVHGVLDADQREELVLELRARRAQWRGEDGQDGGQARDARHHEGLSKLAANLGLSEDQKQAIRREIQAQVDSMFPDRKARREVWEAKMQALGDAFMTDDFDAEDFDLGGEAEEAIASFTTIARKAIDFSGAALDPGQRMLAASLLRSRAEKL